MIDTPADAAGRVPPRLYIVASSQPEPRIAVTISTAVRGQPHGRSRVYRIRPRDIDELLAVAQRMEARR